MLDSCKLFQSVCLLFVILGKGEGRAGEFWYFFFQKKRVGRTLRFSKKKDLYHRNQLSSLRVGELKLYFNHHNITFKGKKDEKVRVAKAHIGSKIFTSIVQDCQKNIQPASDSNSESDSDSDTVECIVQINDSGDLAANSHQGQEAEETIPESGTS